VRRVTGFFILVVTFIGIEPIQATHYQAFDVVGDSVSAGSNPDFYSIGCRYGWVQILFGEVGGEFPPPVDDTLDRIWPGIRCHNSSIPGSKASDWASTSTSLLDTVLQHRPDLVVVLIGGNDFLQCAGDGEVTPQEFDEYCVNLEKIVDRLQANTPRPDLILLDYYDLTDGFDDAIPPEMEIFCVLSPYTLRARNAIRELAAKKGAHFCSIYDAFLRHGYGPQLGDPAHQIPDYFRMDPPLDVDIHPVTEGHRAIYRLVYQKLQDLKAAPLAARSWTYYH